MVATRLNDALATLPKKYYVYLKSYTENVAPWVALALAIYAVTAERLETQARINAERRAQSAEEAAYERDNGVDRSGRAYTDYDPRVTHPSPSVSL